MQYSTWNKTKGPSHFGFRKKGKKTKHDHTVDEKIKLLEADLKQLEELAEKTAYEYGLTGKSEARRRSANSAYKRLGQHIDTIRGTITDLKIDLIHGDHYRDYSR